jgi:beta-galactosidase
MYFGVDYYPEHWVYPYAGTESNPEACWEEDAQMMRDAGVNVVRMGEFTWGLCEPKAGEFDFAWLRRAMEVLAAHGIQTILGTPTAAPPIWLCQAHPEILPVDETGLVRREGTRRAVCLNSDLYWSYSKKIVTAMAQALGEHPALIAWQVDNGIGGHYTEASFNTDTRKDWQRWLEAKYETIPRLNELLGLRQWGQVVTAWEQVPMPWRSPTTHNPALLLDWNRFCSDTIVQFVRMQADLLHELSPGRPVTTNLRPLKHRFNHFDLAEVLDFIAIESTAALRAKSAELACEIDMLRSLKKTGVRSPGGGDGFWVIEHKAGNVSWQDVNSLVRPGILRMFTYQLVSRGADAILFFPWRQPRIGSEKFHGAVVQHHRRKQSRVYREVAQLGEEMRLLAPAIQGTKVAPEVCILFSHENEWALQQPNQPNKHFSLREHIQLYYNALHDRNIPVDFAQPAEDLSRYRLVIAPSLQLMSGAEADNLKLYVQTGGTLLATFNTGLVDEHHIAPDNGFPHDLTDLFGLEVVEFDQLPPGEENHLTFKGSFQTSHLHPARLWCDLIEPAECQVLSTYAKDFYSGKPAMTLNTFGLGKAIYFGTLSHQHFYYDLVTWLRQLCGLHPLLKVPETIEISMRQKDGENLFFVLNHQNSSVRLHFYKPIQEFLTGQSLVGNVDLPPHGVLVLDEHPSLKPDLVDRSQPATT